MVKRLLLAMSPGFTRFVWHFFVPAEWETQAVPKGLILSIGTGAVVLDNVISAGCTHSSDALYCFCDGQRHLGFLKYPSVYLCPFLHLI